MLLKSIGFFSVIWKNFDFILSWVFLISAIIDMVSGGDGGIELALAIGFGAMHRISLLEEKQND